MTPRPAWRSAARQLPLRLSTGLFFLNSGLAKRGADDATAEGLHQFASGTYPVLEKYSAAQFTRVLSAGEIAIAGALLLPVVPAAVAGGDGQEQGARDGDL